MWLIDRLTTDASRWLVWLVLAAAAFLAYELALILHTAFFSPLAAIPGPWHGRFTRLATTYATISRKGSQHLYALHMKYGPFVRIAPDEVIVADLVAYKHIHRMGGGFVKTDMYHYFGPTEAGKPPYGIFQMTNTVEHAKRRKLLGRGFTATSLRNNWEHVVRDKVNAAIQSMLAEAKSHDGEVDVRKWFLLMSSDVVSHIMFGQSFDRLKIGKADPWFDDVTIAQGAAFFALSAPMLYNVLKRLPGLRSTRFFVSHKALYNRGTSALANASDTSETKNLFANVLEQSRTEDETATKLSDADIAVEAASFMVAGSDTTSNSLTYLIYAVLGDAALQRELEDEVGKLEEPLSDAQLVTLPILNATVRETLRLYGAAPGPLPRLVPPSGAELGGYFFPGGATVVTQSWSMHRLPAIFPDPERFDHTRWIPSRNKYDVDADLTNAAFSPFGAGSRVCIGMELAMMELRLTAATFFRKCKGAKLAPSTTPESMEMDNLVLVEPKGKVCRVLLK